MAFYELRTLELHNANHIRAEIANLGADSSWLNGRTDLESLGAIRLDAIQPKLARFLYQEMMLEGGMVFLPRNMDDRSPNVVDTIILGTQTQFEHLIVRLQTQNVEELDMLATELENKLGSWLGAQSK